MRRLCVRVSIVTALGVVLSLPICVRAQTASDTPYTAKCAGCHGSDGTGSSMGKAMGAHDFTSSEVQRMSDSQLSDVITNGKTRKMPAYGKSLNPDDIKRLVAYVRTLKK
jgi:cytochrome c oxidase cbb3-type subunit 3